MGEYNNEADIKCSILVPVYNVEKYIDECIKSVLLQTYDNYELILVDDGSTDNSGFICDYYKNQYEKIHVFHMDNRGPLHARSFAIAHAKGDYVIFLDSDDTLTRNALERIVKSIQEYKCDCLIYGLRVVDGNKTITETFDSEELISDKRELYMKVFMANRYNSLCRKAVKRTVFHDWDYSEYYRIRHGEDLLRSIEIMKYSERVAFIPDLLYNYRVNLQSISNTVDFNHYVYDSTVRQRVADFLIDEKVLTETDFMAYRGYCAKMRTDLIISIGTSSVSKEKKLEILDTIRNERYYKEFLCGGAYEEKRLGNRLLIYKLFEKNHLVMIVNLLNVVRFMHLLTDKTCTC